MAAPKPSLPTWIPLEQEVWTAEAIVRRIAQVPEGQEADAVDH